MAGAVRAGVGVMALGLVGCGGPETFNERRESDSEGEQSAPAPIASPLASAADRQEEQSDAAAAADAAAREREEEDAVPIAAPAAPRMVVDPLVWRERYHWRELAKLAAGESGPRRGGALHLHAPAPTSWSPFGIGLPTGRPETLLPLLYSQLAVMAAGDSRDAHHGQIEGDLAAGWEVPEPEVLVFQVRPDVRWPDAEPLNGRMLTASDAALNHEAYAAPAMELGAAYGAVERVEADDAEMTVAFRLREPASYLPAKMTDPNHVIAPPHYIADPGAGVPGLSGAGGDFPVQGTGPFTLEYASRTSWGMVRNPEYFKRDEATGERLPFLDRIRGGLLLSRTPLTIPLVPRSDIWQDWLDGRFDALELLDPSELAESQESFPDAAAQAAAPTPGNGSEFTFKSIGNGPFADARVRQALSSALDRHGLAEHLHQGLAAADCGHDWTRVADPASATGFREWPWTEAELGESHVFDPERSLSLLAAAGYGPDAPLELNLDSGETSDFLDRSSARAMAVAAHQWQSNLGAAVRVRLLPRSVRTISRDAHSVVREGSPHPEAAVLAHGRLPRRIVDPDDLTYWRMHSSRSQRVRDAVLDDLCERQRGELDAARRSELLEQIRKRDMELAWRLTLVNPYGLMARRGGVFNVGATYLAHALHSNPKQFERAWRARG